MVGHQPHPLLWPTGHAPHTTGFRWASGASGSIHTVNQGGTLKKTSKRKGDPGTLGSPCGSWVPAGKIRAAQPWKIHTPRSRWFSEVTVTKAVTA